MDEKLVIQITAEIGELKKQVAEAKGEVEKMSEDTKAQSSKIDESFKKAGESIKKGMKVAATAVAGAITALVALGPATEEYRINMAKLQTAFESSGSSAETAKNTYNDLYRVMGESDTAVEAANHLAQLTSNQQSLSEWTNICQGVYATFGDSLPIEGLTEAANETAKTGALTGVLADAVNWAGVSEDEFQAKLDACNTESEREALIRETLTGLYGEAAAAYEQNAAQILASNEAQAKLDEAMAATGEALAPVMTTLKELGADVLTAIQPYIQSFAENYLPKIQEVLGGVGEKLEETFQWASEHKALLAVMAGIITGIAVAIGLYNAVAAVKAAMDAAQVATLGALIAAYAAQAAAMMVAIAPYVLIVAAITAVIAVIVLCIKHWDEIKAKVAEVWESIKTKTSEAVEKVKQKFEDMKVKLTEKVENIKTAIQEKFEAIKTAITDKVSAAKEAVINKFNDIKQGITDKINAAKDAVKSAIDKIKGFFNFKWELPKIKLPHFSVSGRFSLNPPSIPRFSVSWYQKGGVFDNPTLFGYGNGRIGGLGENGAEAIVPLEKNTEWLDKIAEKLAAKQGSTPIVLQVDGKTFAQITCDEINRLTKQRGSIPLKVM